MKINMPAFLFMALCIIATQSMARSGDDPFAKSVKVNAGADIPWTIENEVATRSTPGEDDETYYHLVFDKKHLKLQITDSPENSEARAKSFRTFAVHDVLADGERLQLFHWCLYNQDGHARFLQQGQKVKLDICVNDGDRGTFSMQLNRATVETLNKAEKLTFVLKPFRTEVDVTFDISDFSTMLADLMNKEQPAVAAQPAQPEAEPAQVKMCKVSPPEGFTTVKSIEYPCDDATEKARATYVLDQKVIAVRKERERQQKLIADREKKRQEELAAEKRAEEARLMKQELERLEKEAVAASLLRQKELDETITKKMLVLCNKKWADGEHRCFCEKYIEYAPPGIESDPTCP